MYNIAICDDDLAYIETIKEVIFNYCDFSNELLFYEYQTGNELLNCPVQVDVLFLDIQLPGLNGKEIARQFRKNNPQTILVFCTNHHYPTPDDFKVYPFRYVMKDLNNRILKREIPAILQKMKISTEIKYLNVTCDSKIIRIPISSILYIARSKRGSMVHSYEKEAIHCRENIKEIYIQVEKDGFEYAHNSYIVSLSNIVYLYKNVITLKDGTELNISRSKIHKFDNAFSIYLNKRYRRR